MTPDVGRYMAGPCLRVLAPNMPIGQDATLIDGFVAAIADEIKEKDFWVCGRPFFYRIAAADEEYAILTIQGWSPKACISICAMTNNKADHVLLAFASSRIARLLNGWIALNGTMSDLTHAPAVLTFDGKAGRIITEEGWDVVSPQYMNFWLSHEEFRLHK
jgi:hypothetical protein